MKHKRKLKMILSISERLQELINEGADLFIRERHLTEDLKAPSEIEKLEHKIAMREALKRMFELTEPEEYGIKNNSKRIKKKI